MIGMIFNNPLTKWGLLIGAFFLVGWYIRWDAIRDAELRNATERALRSLTDQEEARELKDAIEKHDDRWILDTLLNRVPSE